MCPIGHWCQTFPFYPLVIIHWCLSDLLMLQDVTGLSSNVFKGNSGEFPVHFTATITNSHPNAIPIPAGKKNQVNFFIEVHSPEWSTIQLGIPICMMIIIRATKFIVFYVESLSRKSPKKVTENRKNKEKVPESRKKHLGGNRKIPPQVMENWKNGEKNNNNKTDYLACFLRYLSC